MSRRISRRDFLASGLAMLAVGPVLLRRTLQAPSVSDGPYGPLLAPDANGVMLPEGFTSRVVARSGQPVDTSAYAWHDAPDGGATFASDDGGWIYVSNSEVGGGRGGVGALRFAKDGRVTGAYPIATGTSRNCAGGPTPWGTWLSCEEHDRGRVWECDPTGKREAKPLPALGVFTHEAAAVDPVNQAIYLTEDEPDGRFYRFVPNRYPRLDDGVLEVAQVGGDGRTRWHRVPDPAAGSTPTRNQVPASTRFNGGEGTWFDAGVVYFTTKGDDRVWSYDTRGERMSLLYDAATLDGTTLRGVDNITGASKSGDLFIAEDGGDLEIVMITPKEEVARLLRLTGPAHNGSEIAGPAFDPSGRRLYFSSQRGFGRGVTYEVSGPFRATRAERPKPLNSPSPLPLASDDDDGGISPVSVGVAAAGVTAAAIGGREVLRRRRRAAEGPRGS